MARFFLDESQIQDQNLILSGDQAAHAKVLRLKVGETVVVCDGKTQECVCQISDVVDGSYILQVTDRRPISSEAAVKASVYMAFSKGDKLEHVIQKATELGAAEVVAFPTARCISRPDDKSLAKKLERWNKIAASAAEQSGRGVIPQVVVLKSYREALERAIQSDLAILFYENERCTTLQAALNEKPFASISLMTGPEGGLDPQEVQLAVEQGLRVCTLGSRILRCETAPLCALSAVMYHTGEF